MGLGRLSEHKYYIEFFMPKYRPANAAQIAVFDGEVLQFAQNQWLVILPYQKYGQDYSNHIWHFFTYWLLVNHNHTPHNHIITCIIWNTTFRHIFQLGEKYFIRASTEATKYTNYLL